MKRRVLCLALVLAIIITIMPAFEFQALAASSDADMDALTALGIDSSKAPDGYDPLSTDNPYGKNTVEVSPVSELYTVGLNSGVSYDATYTTTSTIQNGGNKEAHSASAANFLKSTLYGNEQWNATTVSGIMGSGASSTAASGATTATGSYTLISTGTVSDTAASNIPAKGYLTNASGASTDFGNSFKFALSSVAAGNFDGNTSGLSAQTAMVYTSDYSANGGLYLRFGSAESGTYGSNAKELLATTKNIGNPSLKYNDKLVENFAENPYQLQNYLQTATGDWNGDGLDEVAVYVPEQGNSRIVVYALQLTNADNTEAYLDASKWSVVWTYYLREGDVVSNMVSLVSGDVNQDGTDDLAATWGYYYGPYQNLGSTAVVMFGAKGTAMLTNSQQFSLTYDSSNIVRASFAFGDMAGSDSDVLILCGQSDADLKAGNTQTRYVALYNWELTKDGPAFVASQFKQNFDLFAKEDGNYVWTAMAGRSSDKFYSLPLCAANVATISQGISKDKDLLYFDSLIIEMTDKGLSIKAAWDNFDTMQQNTASCVEYVEYGAAAGDLTGQTGTGALVTMTQTLSTTAQNTTSYTLKSEYPVPVYDWSYYYDNWLYELFGIKTWYTYIKSWTTAVEDEPVSVGYEQLTMGKAYMVTADPLTGTNYFSRTQTDISTSLCLANTDNDSSYMSYSGKHYFTYTDPQVLAVLASPPYFSDLMNRDDLSGGYSQSATKYSSTSGSGSGYNVSATIKVGAYVSYEQDVEVFGVKVASFEAEASVTAGFTFETESTSTLEQTVTYSATSGEDMVAFYSIPMEIYEYKSYVPDGSGGYKEVLTTVNIPHEAAVSLKSLSEYESIAEDYSILPSIAENVLTHVNGDPFSYPTGTTGYDVIAQYKATASAVGFTSAPSGSSISQEIAMSKETNNAFTASAAVEAKAGGGPGGLKVGFIAGAEVGAGFVLVSTSGSSFSGDMQNMPIEAQPYGYGMNWRIFCYKYSNGNTSFPVVSYIVSDVHSPATLPKDFEQNIPATTADSVTLDWSYDKIVAGFKIYRYYEFPEGSGSYEVAFIPFTSATSYDDIAKTYNFTYKDKGLSPYTEYFYQIQTVSATDPKQSICSEPMSCRTKTTVGYPVMSIDGLDGNGKLPIYPDAASTVTVNVASSDSYNSLSYQWQKLVEGKWVELSGKTDNSLTLSNAGAADNGYYRCRVNAIYYDKTAAQNYYISAFSDEIVTAYSKRSAAYSLAAYDTIGSTSYGLHADIELHSAIKNHSMAPTGNVTFNIAGTDYNYSETVKLASGTNPTTKVYDDESKQYSTASLDLPDLPVGVYTVTAYYAGSRIFRDMETDAGTLVVVGNAAAKQLELYKNAANGKPVTQFVYGDNITPILKNISKDGGTITSDTVAGVSYKLIDADSKETIFTAGSATPNVGTYTLEAYIDDNGTPVLAATQDFSVTQKPIKISIAIPNGEISQENVPTKQPSVVCSNISTDELNALKLTYKAVNSAGNTVALTAATDPGNYTVTACTSGATPVLAYNNYSVSYESAIYTIKGAFYRLTAVAQDYTDKAGTRPVGTIGISNTEESYADYADGTAIMLYATPNDGYEVDKWSYNGTVTQTGGKTFAMFTDAEVMTVSVTFKPAAIMLYAMAQPTVGGEVTCSDTSFSSGAYVSNGAEFTFTAKPSAGYHFNKWRTVSGGTAVQSAGTANSDGSNRLNVTVGTASTYVYADFTRDSYTLNLSGDIKAYYMYDDDGNVLTPKVEKAIASGSSIVGDTVVTVLPKTGYQAAPGASFTVNGVATADSSSHQFTITQNSTVSLSTVRNSYAVTATGENGIVSAKIGGVAANAGALASVQGGSALTFTAKADRGYVFDHWTLNGVAVPGGSATLTIQELGAKTDVVAVFIQNTAYTATAALSAPTRGTMKYSLYDIYGEVVGTINTPMPAEGIKVYKAETIILSVTVNTGSMVEQWKVNDANSYTTQKTYTISNINSNISATAYLKAASSYMVDFVAAGTTGSTLTAKADDLSFDSGTLQYGGSDLVFSAAPADGYMLDYWTVTNGDLAVPESADKVTDANGTMLIDPQYTLDLLRQNITVRAHFIELTTNKVEAFGSTDKGDSAITYVTPIQPGNGECNAISADVRTGGTVKMAFTPNSGYATSIDLIKAAIDADVNDDASVTVVKSGEQYLATVANLKAGISLAKDDIYKTSYTITAPAGVTASANIAVAGETITLIVKPSSGYKLSTLSLDNGTLNEVVSAEKLTYTFTMPESSVAVAVEFVQAGGGGIVGPAAPAEEEYEIPASSGENIPVTVSGGIAAMDLQDDALNGLTSSSDGTISFDLSELEGVTGASISSDAFDALVNAAQDPDNNIDGVSIALPDAEVTFDTAALAAIGSGGGDVTLTAQMLEKKNLTDEQQTLVGDRPIIDLTLKAGDETISDFGSGSVEVKVPYTLKTGESADAVVVWYLNDDNVLESITGKFDADSGCVIFTTDHFSKYVIGSLPFDDVDRDKWYFDSVSFAYANGLFSGTEDAIFDPTSSMTRAMLVTVLWRLEGEPAASDGEFTDVPDGEWYAKAVAWAYENGIVSGYGDGVFGANDEITREQLASILMKYSEYKKYDVSKKIDLSAFNDSKTISTWAIDAMKWANAEGLINGTGNATLSPKGNAERCQVAAILQRFIENVVE